MAIRHAEMPIELGADGADRTIRHDCQRGMDVHAGHEPGLRVATFVRALIE